MAASAVLELAPRDAGGQQVGRLSIDRHEVEIPCFVFGAMPGIENHRHIRLRHFAPQPGQSRQQALSRGLLIGQQPHLDPPKQGGTHLLQRPRKVLGILGRVLETKRGRIVRDSDG